MPQEMAVLRADRVVSARRRGSSRPVLVETSSGIRFVKLRGAGQGTAALVAEIIVAEIATAIGLHVPVRSVVALEPGIPVADWDDELADLLAASVGWNLGFEYLDHAVEIPAGRFEEIPARERSAVLWLDRFTMNPDRTVKNPNMLLVGDRLWLIDHGAALGFQYAWHRVTEDAPRKATARFQPHAFDHLVSFEDLKRADRELAPRVTRAVLETAVAAVPDDFLVPLVTIDVSPERRRAAYVAYLWKRLKPPRPFLETGGGPPAGTAETKVLLSRRPAPGGDPA